MTPTAAPVAAIHRNARRGEVANVQMRKAASKMPAEHGGMRAAKAAAKAAMASTSSDVPATAVACRQSASRHCRRADCHDANKRNTPSTERPARSRNASTRSVAGASARHDQMTRNTLHAGNVGRLACTSKIANGKRGPTMYALAYMKPY